MIISKPKEFIAEWVEKQVGMKFTSPYSVLASTDAGNHITAALIFQNWTGQDIEISVAADSIPRSLLAAAYRYVVVELGCGRATFKTSVNNLAAVHAMQRLGAKCEGRQRSYYGEGRDAYVFGILKEDYPFGK